MSDQLQPSLEKPLAPPRPPVGGFWLRACAMAIDIGLLALIFSYAAELAYVQLYPVRWWCQVVAILITFVYFWIGSSSITDGQTLGKKLMGLRLVSTDSAPLRLGQAALRAAITQLIVLAFLSLLSIFGTAGIEFPVTSGPLLLGKFTVGFLAVAYTLATAVFCALGPKKLSFHDLVAKTAVVRVGEEAAGIAFVNSWDDMDGTKRKMAIYPSVTIAIIVLFLLVMALKQAVPELSKSLGPHKVAESELNSPPFRLVAMGGPSEDAYQRFQKSLDAAGTQWKEAVKKQQKGQGSAPAALAPPTTETLRFAYDGRKFVFVFDCSETFTSQSLTADPRYKQIIAKLPALADRLSPQFFKSKEGQPAPYTGIQVEFIETLPLYLYSSTKAVWHDILPVKGHEPATPRRTDNERTTNPRPAGTPTPAAKSPSGSR